MIFLPPLWLCSLSQRDPECNLCWVMGWLLYTHIHTHTHTHTHTYLIHIQVGHIAWHPSASDILASVGFDHKIIIWNTLTGEAAYTLEGFHSDIIYSVSWNYNGSLLASTCKDKKIRVLDPRKNAVVMVSSLYFNAGTCSIRSTTDCLHSIFLLWHHISCTSQ